MEIKLHEDYEQIDKENIVTFKANGIKSQARNVYRCVVCGVKACIDDSVSCRGHRLMHTDCMVKMFGYERIVDAFEWMRKFD